MKIEVKPKNKKEKKRFIEIQKDVIDIYELIYTKYTSILKFIGIISIGIFSVSSNLIFSTLIDNPEKELSPLLVISLVIIFIAGVCSFL